jgi:hypothetical protein
MKRQAAMPQDGAPYYYAPYPPPPASAGGAAPTWRAKAGYIGTGVVIGLVIYPFVRKTLTKLQPGLDKLFDGLTGKAEGMAEMAADFIAKAKQNLKDEVADTRKSDGTPKESHDHEHPHDHDHDHEH